MSVEDFVDYIGDYRIHDSTILEIRSYEKAIDVVLKTMDGEIITVTFFGLARVTANNPVGMFLYALTDPGNGRHVS